MIEESALDTVRILLIEDNDSDARLIQGMLGNSKGYQFYVTHIKTLEALKPALVNERFDVMLLDLNLPDVSGMETIVTAHQTAEDIPIVIMSASSEEALTIAALQAGAQDYLIKGSVDSVNLIRSIRYAMERHQLKRALKRVTEEQRFLATHDPLTQMPNRQLFQDRLGQAITRSTRYDYQFALLFIDLDGFKTVNDTMGHDIGDELLVAVSDRLEHCVRSTDTIARLGGDEFTVILTQLESIEVAAKIASAIIKKLSDAFHIKGQELHISASIGISLFPDDGCTETVLMKNADTAMYEAKRSGKNQYCFFTDSLNQHLKQLSQLRDELQRALRENQFILVYQPQIDTQSNKVSGIEVFLRWQHPERGLLRPDAFLKAASHSHLILDIDDFVLNAVSEHLLAWEKQGLPALRVSINFSAKQFEQQDFAGNFLATLRKKGVKPSRLCIEIDEQSLSCHPENIQTTLTKLSQAGVHIDIDNFGSAHLSLETLKSLPIRRLKIERTLVHSCTEDSANNAIVQSIIAIAANMGMEVIAEGVETEAQQNHLRTIGCQHMQGRFFGAPMPVTELEQFVEKNTEEN